MLLWCFGFSSHAVKIWCTSQQNFEIIHKGSCRSLKLRGTGNPKPVSFNHLGVNLLAAMEVHKVAEGNSYLPPPKTPALLSSQTELTMSPWRCALAHRFDSSEWPLAHFSACRGCCIIAHEACPWHGVPYNLPSKHWSQPDRNTDFLKHLQTFPWPLTKFPNFTQNFKFSWLEKSS